LLHPSTEHVVSVDPACTVAGAPLTGGPMRGRGPVTTERIGIAVRSRLTVDGLRPSSAAITRTVAPDRR